MVALAKRTDSVHNPGSKMYLDQNIEDGVAVEDAVVLINKVFGIPAYTKKYPGTPDEDGDNIPGSLKDEQLALSDMEAALARGYATMVTVNSSILWPSAVNQTETGTPNYSTAQHEAVVIFVDLPNSRVYLNDSGVEFGLAMEVPLGAFLNAWQTGGYELTIVGQADPSATA